MNTVPLTFLSEAKLAELRSQVASNLSRYVADGFADLEPENGWAIESSDVRVDTAALAQLSHAANDDVASSLSVHAALDGMTPALAAEERVWVRLTHIECIDYTRARWLMGKSGQALEGAILKHAFAGGRTGVRDDNAISRLWWNTHIATIADPKDPASALALIAKTADIRQGFVERPGTASRPPLARAVIRAMRNDPWIASAEPHFREFMKVLNRDGSGILFEALSDAETDELMKHCSARAQAHLDQKGA